MKPQKKIRVAVLYGGRSTEHEVSVSSAHNVMDKLDRSLFEVIPIKIDKQGSWFLDAEKLPQLTSAVTTPQKIFAPVWLNEPETLRKTQLAEIHHAFKTDRLFDVIFPIMHGTFSEDGTIQGLLELADVPYVGCGVLTSAIGMDKDFARRLINHAGLQSVPYIAIQQSEWNLNAAAIETQIWQAFTLPLFVKPANQGSSIGVKKVRTQEELKTAIQHAFAYDTKILVEQGIAATELEVAMLEALEEGAEPFVSQIGEVRPHDEFYTYHAKYAVGGSDFLVPAEIPLGIQQQLQDLSRRIFKILSIEGMSRVDFFMDKNTHEIYFNEINTIPGFTPTSMYPMMITQSGISFSELLTRLVMLAIKRYEKKQSLERNYLV